MRQIQRSYAPSPPSTSFVHTAPRPGGTEHGEAVARRGRGCSVRPSTRSAAATLMNPLSLFKHFWKLETLLLFFFRQIFGTNFKNVRGRGGGLKNEEHKRRGEKSEESPRFCFLGSVSSAARLFTRPIYTDQEPCLYE